MMTVREGMDGISGGGTEVNKWGIGQIAALFAWAPLMMDMCYDGSEVMQEWWVRRRQTRMGAKEQEFGAQCSGA